MEGRITTPPTTSGVHKRAGQSKAEGISKLLGQTSMPWPASEDRGSSPTTYSDTPAPSMLMAVELVAFGPMAPMLLPLLPVGLLLKGAPTPVPVGTLNPHLCPSPAFICPQTADFDCSCCPESSCLSRFLSRAPGTQLHKSNVKQASPPVQIPRNTQNKGSELHTPTPKGSSVRPQTACFSAMSMSKLSTCLFSLSGQRPILAGKCLDEGQSMGRTLSRLNHIESGAGIS
jgi:hypothetical protein